MAAGRRLNWFEDKDDVPHRVWSETGGPGDDIRLVFADATTAEAQVKKGLKAGPRLWEALIALAQGVSQGTVDRGLLIICPRSSARIGDGLREDLSRIGQGRTDGLSPLGAAFLKRLETAGLGPDVCAKIRIQTLRALPGDEADVRLAETQLAAVLERHGDMHAAWAVLLGAASRMIVERGAQRLGGLIDLFETAGLGIARDPAAGAAALSRALKAWTLAAHADLAIIGLARSAPLKTCWIPIKAVVHDEAEPPKALHEAVARYHSWSSLHRPSGKHLDPLTLGRFYTRAVIVAGPGMGKSTLLRRLALVYAEEGRPVVRVPLRAVAARMAERGEALGEAVFAVGLADFSARSHQVRRGLSDWVLLCDGLDECGRMQGVVAEGLRHFALAHPGITLVVTTRPVGYRRASLSAWRHYGLFPGDDGQVTAHLQQVLEEALSDQPAALKAAIEGVRRLESGKLKAVIARSPLLLTLAASLLARGAELGNSEPGLYDRMIQLIETEPAARKPVLDVSATILSRFLELLAVTLLDDPLADRATALARCADALRSEMSWPALRARGAVDECAAHWEAVGIIERLWHDEADALTFVHKTFGEFLAARSLLRLDESDLAARLAGLIADAGWSAALDFAAAAGAAPLLIHLHLEKAERDNDPSHLRMALRLAAGHDPPEQLRARLLTRAVETMASPDVRAARHAAEALDAWGEAHSGAIAAAVQPLLRNHQPWTRLSAWSFVLNGAATDYDLGDLQEALKEVPDHGFAVPTPLGGGIDLADLGVSRVIERLLIRGVRIVLERLPPHEADALLAPILQETTRRGHMDFGSALRRLLKEFGRDYGLSDAGARFAHSSWLLNPEYDAAEACAYRRFLVALTPEGERPPEWSGALEQAYELAGFLDAVGWDERLSSDAWAWRCEQCPESLACIVQVSAQLAGLPMGALRAQALVLLAELELTEDGWSVASRLPSVDHPQIDWSRATALALAPPDLEPALYHLSDFVVKLAAYLIHAVASVAVRSAIGERAISGGRGFTLAAGVYLAQAGGVPETVTLIHERLGRPLDDGCGYLFKALAALEHPLDSAALASLDAGLSAEDPEVAIAAAELAVHYSEACHGERTLPILEAAYRRWIVREPPEPDRGVRPRSPRDAILKAWWRLQPPGVDTLLSTLGDGRNEIAQQARKRLLDRALEEPDVARRLVDAMLSDEPAGELVPALLRDGAPLGPASVSRLRTLLRSDDPHRRHAVLPLLHLRYMTQDEVEAEARRLRSDPYSEIRKQAEGILRGLPAAPTT